MHCRILPRRACNPCGYAMKMSSWYHRLLIYDVKLTTKIGGMGPFIVSVSLLYNYSLACNHFAEQIETSPTGVWWNNEHKNWFLKAVYCCTAFS